WNSRKRWPTAGSTGPKPTSWCSATTCWCPCCTCSGGWCRWMKLRKPSGNGGTPCCWPACRPKVKKQAPPAGLLRRGRRQLAGSIPADLQLLRHRLGQHEELHVVGPAGLGVGAAQVEAAEGLGSHQGAGDLPVEVQVAHMELPPGLLQVGPVAGVHAARQAVDGAVGH